MTMVKFVLLHCVISWTSFKAW